MRIVCAIFVDMYYDKTMRSLEYHTFWPACQKLGEAALFAMDTPISRRELNTQFLHLVERFEPNIVLTVPVTDEWQPGTMESLDCPTVAWICDSYREDYVTQEVRKYSHIVGTDKKTGKMAISLGKPFLRSTWACNPDFHKSAEQKDLDIVWIGQGGAWRGGYVKALREALGDRFIARGWNFPGGPVTWEEYIELLGRAKIGLSLSRDRLGVPQAKLRDFEIPACGGLLLVEKPNLLEGYLQENTHYVGFSSTEELVERADFWLRHDEEREAIAQRCHGHVIREHTFEKRLREVFQWALSTQA